MTFCLDGEPLIVLSFDGQFAEYRTVQDRYVKILSQGGVSPRSFTVYGRDGRISVYGETPDSYAEVGPARLGWRLSSISDRSLNTIEFSYT